MKKRLTMALATGALVLAMVPGAASAGAPSAVSAGACDRSGFNFGELIYWFADTEFGSSLGQVMSRYRIEKATCPDGFGSLTVNGQLVDSFSNQPSPS